MSDLAIRVENLSKLYRIGPRERYKTLRDTLTDVMYAPFRRFRSTLQRSNAERANDDDTIWALKDVSFEVQRGEVIGIIGRNGAGKTTLLKVLSRITEPTEGRAEIHGRVGSLLEVGTGFHPELTGRENIYLNGAILGMKRAEIERKFDEIVAFAEIEKFLDTPVKRYSSGMYVRLAFAVAAHLEPEILLVDEVLAVGDVAFQKKCFDKMEEVGREGKTVLVVSHNMASITRLCERALLLNSGRIQCAGSASEVVGAYMLSDTGLTSHREWSSIEAAPGNEIVRLKSIKVCSTDGEVGEAFDIRYPIAIVFEYWVCKENIRLNPGFFLLNEAGTIVFMSGGMHDPEWLNRPRSTGLYNSRCWIPGNFLAEGTFSVHAIINTLGMAKSPIVHVYERDAIAFQVYDTLEGDSARGQHRGAYHGVVRPILQWETYPDGSVLSECLCG